MQRTRNRLEIIILALVDDDVRTKKIQFYIIKCILKVLDLFSHIVNCVSCQKSDPACLATLRLSNQLVRVVCADQ